MKRIIVIAINMAVCTVGISILLFAILLLAGIRPYVVLSGSCLLYTSPSPRDTR